LVWGIGGGMMSDHIVPAAAWLPMVLQITRRFGGASADEQAIVCDKIIEGYGPEAGAKAKEIFAAQGKAEEARRLAALPPWKAKLEPFEDWHEWLAAAVEIAASGAASAEHVAAEAERWGSGGGEEFREALRAKTEPEPESVEALPAQLPAVTQPSSAAIVAGIEPEIIEMNYKHAVISNLGGKCVVMEWVPSAISKGDKELGYQSFASFRERYGNKYIDVPSGPRSSTSRPLAKYWLEHPQRRQYEGLDLIPNGPAVSQDNYLNLWRGWGVPPQKGRWRLMQRHIAEVLANGDARFEDYIGRSAAWKFQNPGLPPEAALVLRGGKGSGKGAWGHIMMRIFGQHALQIFSSEHLCGKHNAHLQNKLFLFSDEATWAGDHQPERVLKGIVTEKFMMIEPKGVNAFPWPNRLGLYMAANAKWVVPASHDERRFAVNNVSERWKQNPDYFRPLFEEINNGGAAAMLYDLLHLDLEGWHPAENIPQTKALVEQKLQGLTGLQQWYVYMLSVGLHPVGNVKNPRRVLARTLLADARDYTPRNRYITPEELAAFLKEMGFESKSDGRARSWVFPPLAEAREAWIAGAGGNWEWDAPDISEWGEKPRLLDELMEE
jgi:Family of unknown function (DUF5906)